MNITAVTVDPTEDDHAAAMAYVAKTVTDLQEAKGIIGQLRADLHRCEDRVEMLNEERNFYRDQANAFRALLVKLSTHQATIGLETVAAQAVVMSIDAAINKADPPASLVALEQEIANGNEAA
jgi:hypothetical protein